MEMILFQPSILATLFQQQAVLSIAHQTKPGKFCNHVSVQQSFANQI